MKDDDDNRFEFDDIKEWTSSKGRLVDSTEYIVIDPLNSKTPEFGTPLEFQLPRRPVFICNQNMLTIKGSLQKQTKNAAGDLSGWQNCVAADATKVLLSEMFPAFFFPYMDMKKSFRFLNLEGWLPGGRALAEIFHLQHLHDDLKYLYGPRKSSDPSNFVSVETTNWVAGNADYRAYAGAQILKGADEFVVNYCPKFFLFENGPRSSREVKILPNYEETLTLHVALAKNDHLAYSSDGTAEFRFKLSKVQLWLAVPRLTKAGEDKLAKKSLWKNIIYPGNTKLQFMLPTDRTMGRRLLVENQKMPTHMLIQRFAEGALLGMADPHPAAEKNTPAYRPLDLLITNAEVKWDGLKLFNDHAPYEFTEPMALVRQSEFINVPAFQETISPKYHIGLANYSGTHLMYTFISDWKSGEPVRAIGQEDSGQVGRFDVEMSTTSVEGNVFLVTLFYNDYVRMDYNKGVLYNPLINAPA